MANLVCINRHGMPVQVAKKQWDDSSPAKKEGILKAALGTSPLVHTFSQLGFSELNKELVDGEMQTVFNRLAMDAGFMD